MSRLPFHRIGESNSDAREKRFLQTGLSIKEMSDAGIFTGDLSVYGVKDYAGEIVDKGAFTKSMKENPNIPALWQHKSDTPVGALILTDSSTALQVKGTLNLNIQAGRDTYEVMKFNKEHNIPTGLSIGFFTIKDEMKDGTRHLKEVKLIEGSVVTFAANPLALVTTVKAAEDQGLTESGKKDFTDMLTRIELYSRGYQLMDALCSSLMNGMYEYDNADEAQAQAKADINAFSGMYTSFLSDYYGYFSKNENEKPEIKASLKKFFQTEAGKKYLDDIYYRYGLQFKFDQALPDPDDDDDDDDDHPDNPGPDDDDDEAVSIAKSVLELFGVPLETKEVKEAAEVADPEPDALHSVKQLLAKAAQ